VAPIDKTMPAEKRVDVVRFLEELKDKVAQSIPDALYHRVRVSSLGFFIVRNRGILSVNFNRRSPYP
jgi:hypothetical protein